jgi:MerR family transcriptional regulator, light-induced transcriptional regulator
VSDEHASLRIGELARRAGLPPATLRSWERRYGIVEPQRTDSGYRLYSARDERRLKAMVELIAGGLAPAEAAERVLSDRSEPRSEPPAGATSTTPAVAAEALRAELLDCLRRYDETGAHRAIDRAVDAYSTEALLVELIMPVLGRTGKLWRDGEITVGQEHFVSNVLRGRVLAMARGWGGGVGPAALLACPDGEEHDLGLIAFGLLLRQRGWRITFLGADTPLATIIDVAATLAPRLVVLSLTGPDVAESLGAEGPIELVAPLLIGGAAASQDLADRVGARALPEDVAAAAEIVATLEL